MAVPCTRGPNLTPCGDIASCKPCWLYENDPRYRRLWGAPGNGAAVKAATARAVPAPAARSAPCIHLGGPTGRRVDCSSCQGHVELKLRACALYGECLPGAKAAPGVRSCQGCPDYLALSTSSHRDKAQARWARQADVKDAHIRELAAVASTPHTPPALEGDGVVICGGGRYWPMIELSVRMLREVSALPVQIWHRGSGEPVSPEDLAGVEGVEYRDTTALRPAPRILGGWEAKTLALLHCGWRRVLYLDADAYCVADPAAFLELASAHRFVFWSDPARETIRWQWYGLAAALPTLQGGQLALDLAAFWRELVVANWINQHSDYFYQHQYGDQDSWRVALAATGAAARGDYRCLGTAPWKHPAFVCGLSGPMIVHRCQGKIWSAADRAQAARHLPKEDRVWHHVRAREARRAADARTVFGQVYASGLWGHGTASGGGSTGREAAPYLAIVNELLRREGAKSVVDLGCGDGLIAARIVGERVTGVDVHNPHLERLRRDLPSRTWLEMDFDRDRESIPPADVWLVKDVFQHWPDALVRDWLCWARGAGRCKLLLVTNDRVQAQADPPLGGYRGLDPERPPLAELGFERVADYLHKSVLALRLA